MRLDTAGRAAWDGDTGSTAASFLTHHSNFSVDAQEEVLLSSPNRTRKSGAIFFSTTGMTYGETAVLSALIRPDMMMPLSPKYTAVVAVVLCRES